MSPPISIGGDDVSSITVDGDGVSEVTVDGDTVWTAIPDSEANQKLVHRWVLNDVNGTVDDSEGDADGTVNGVASVSGDWAGGSAGEGDGVDDYIETTDWGSFGSSMNTDFAIAFSISGLDTTDTVTILGVGNSEDDTLLSIQVNNTTSDVIEWRVRGAQHTNNNSTGADGSTDITNGGTYRVVCNKTGNTDSDLDMWVNQVEDSTTGTQDEPVDSPTDFGQNMTYFAYNSGGGLIRYLPATLDDMCVFNDSLSQSEIGSYQNPWS